VNTWLSDHLLALLLDGLRGQTAGGPHIASEPLWLDRDPARLGGAEDASSPFSALGATPRVDSLCPGPQKAPVFRYFS
jgi:hypothetical protein